MIPGVFAPVREGVLRAPVEVDLVDGVQVVVVPGWESRLIRTTLDNIFSIRTSYSD
jgi:hypothetical protein